jgi:hypothetical protein
MAKAGSMKDTFYLWARIPGVIAILIGAIAGPLWLMWAGFGWWVAVMLLDLHHEQQKQQGKQ